MTPFTHHLFICGNCRAEGHPRGSCDPEGQGALKQAFKNALTKRGLRPQVRANHAGCLDQCELGPAVVIYPQEIWYGGVTLSDVDRIVEQTIIKGEVITELQIKAEMLNTKGKGQANDGPCNPSEGSSS